MIERALVSSSLVVVSISTFYGESGCCADEGRRFNSGSDLQSQRQRVLTN
jgi:hypothetical protein